MVSSAHAPSETNWEAEMAKTYCPECDAVITIDDPELGALFKCPECEAELEVISSHPLDVYFHFEEEWGDDWDKDEDWDSSDDDDKFDYD
jgi:lysine biosynthesis protein LysW